MMLDKVIEPDSLRTTADGASIGLRLPWYRTLPLSTVDVDYLAIDNVEIPAEKLALEINGTVIPVSDLRRQTGQGWFVTDMARLHAEGVQIDKGSEHEIQVLVSLYPPYIRGLRRAVRWSLKMEAR